MTRVTIFSEYASFHKTNLEAVKQYPDGVHKVLENIFQGAGFKTITLTISEGEDGTTLTDEILYNTDVLVWWGHMLHDSVSDSVVDKVLQRVYEGMGCIFLHSSHMAKPFRRLMGTTCTLSWREINEKERLWVVSPSHPIVQGLPESIELLHEEMYGEFFDIPKPEELVFIGWFKGGEVFRSGVTYTRGNGKIFYFQPGHETNESFYNEYVQKILVNAVNWAKSEKKNPLECRHVANPPEKIGGI